MNWRTVSTSIFCSSLGVKSKAIEDFPLPQASRRLEGSRGGAENNNLPRAEEACRERPGNGKTTAFRGVYHAFPEIQLCDHCSGSGAAV